MIKKVKNWLGVIAFVAAILIMFFILLRMRGCVHHNLYYKGLVERQVSKNVKPYLERLNKLEARIEKLEKSNVKN